MTTFSEIPWFIIKDYTDNLLTTSPSGQITFYKKSDTSNYIKVKGTVESSQDDYTEYNRLTLGRIFDIDGNGDYLYDIINGDDIYIRKDDDFIKWIEDNWSDYEGFLNPEVKYLYLGEGYKDNVHIYINHYTLKDWMLDALPENDRNDTLDEFFYILYDQLYHKIYSMEKNLFTLFDPYEIDSDLLDDIITMYNESPLSSDIDIYKRRVYTANIIYWLKKKGTYAALFIVWHLLTKETGNDLIVYDRWHLDTVTGSPSEHFEDYDYTDFYDASADYPITFTTFTTSGSTSIHNQTTSSTSWSVIHELNSTDLIIQVYNWDLNKIIPKSIEIVDNENIEIEFDTEASGCVLIIETDHTEVSNGTITHSLSGQYVISQHYKDNILMIPFSVEATDNNNLTIETSAGNVDNYILTPEYTHNQITKSDTWNVEHNLNYIGVIANVYNSDDEKILPESISLRNENKCVITFSEPLSGYCGVISVADVNEALSTTKILSTHYKVEMNLNNNPFGTNILPEDLMNDLYDKWENNRPVTKFSHYHINLPITTDFSGSEIKLFDDPLYDANIYSRCVVTYTENLSGGFIYSQISSSSTEWTVNHELDTDKIITHIYDLDLNKIFPDIIEIIDSDNIKIIFNTPATGVAFISLIDYNSTDPTETITRTETHNLNSQYVVSQFYREKLTQPKIITATDNNTLTMETSGTSGDVFIIEPDYTHSQEVSAASTWTINHNLGHRAVILDVYNHNDEKIVPDNISLDNINTCTLTFSELTSGNCGVVSIGNPINLLGSEFGVGFDVKIGNGTDLDLWDYATENNIKSTFYTINCSGSDNFTEEDNGVRIEFSIPKNVKGYITEIGIFNNSDNLTWYSRIDNIYKHKDVILDVNYFAQYWNE